MNQNPETNLVLWQRRLFEILDEFFRAATGIGPESLPLEEFDDWIRQNAAKIAPRAHEAFSTAHDSLATLYDQSRQQGIFGLGQRLGGLKLVMGGSSRFTQSHLASVRKMGLYADTIFIPDPILPWIESPRAEEEFRDVWLLKSAFLLLPLKPLIDAQFAYPPIVVFPSWEKTLEAQDDTTREGQLALITAVLAHSLGRPFESFEELSAYVKNEPDEFLSRVDEQQLLVAPDGDIGDPLERSISLYREEIRTWRTQEYQRRIERLTDAEFVMNGLCERIGPQYHFLENAGELGAGPMFSLHVHWHYYRKCAALFESRLQHLSLLGERSTAEVRALEEQSFEWLGDLSIDALVHLRQNGENEEFRDAIRKFTSELSEASLEDLDRVVGEVGRGISSLLTEHQRTIREIQEKYRRHSLHTALLVAVTGAAVMLPALAPLVGGGGLLAAAGKFAWDAISEELDYRQASHSLMGILAEVKTRQ